MQTILIRWISIFNRYLTPLQITNICPYFYYFNLIIYCYVQWINRGILLFSIAFLI